MNRVVKPIIVCLLTAFTIAGCSSSPELEEDQWNTADEQRSRADKAQHELSSETSSE